jgi:NADPH-dependent 2,4-dienoyl-CoA reductase/sulfur reductase-like enzyme/nitrite reductase/ring-hydroxylating ferredoxin subunit
MGSTNQELSGPDFAAGLELDQLPDGAPLLGHAGGEAVILVRRGNDVFATGASCSHYGGPLAEGIVVGGTIRCPWHHACFDLRTGEATRAPALSAIPCYAVVRQGSRVLVGTRKDVPRRALEAAAPASVVVVGAGPAGAAAVEALRRAGYRGPVTLIGDEEPGPVDRPNLSKDYLAGTAPEEWIPLRTPDFYREIEVDFVLGDPVEKLDTNARQVVLRSGRTTSYGALLLATGAEPRRLDVPGADLPHVHVLRTLAHSRAIIDAARGKQRAVVIGSSFIGLEVAASLRKRGLDVSVVGPEQVPLARVLGEEIGRRVQKLHEEHGVRFYLERRPSRIGERSVTLDDGAELGADLVVAGVGVRPRTKLAESAGLRVDSGIVVDELLRTSAEGVYAAGDVARYPNPAGGELMRVEHFVHAERQGQAAARNLLGPSAPFRDPPFFWSAHYDQNLCYVGHAPAWERVTLAGSLERFDFAAGFWRGSQILAVVTASRDRVSLLAEAAFEAGDHETLARLLA